MSPLRKCAKIARSKEGVIAVKEQKTNVMRILDQKKIPYEAKHYPHGDEAVDGVTVAQSLGQDPASVFKTLVTHGAKGGYYVFVIPVAEELDLKKAAKAVGEKSVAMIPQKELLPLTGYVHGGCSPVGMKKKYPTFMDETAELYDEIAISGGARGLQMVLSPMELMEYADITSVDLVEY